MENNFRKGELVWAENEGKMFAKYLFAAEICTGKIDQIEIASDGNKAKKQAVDALEIRYLGMYNERKLVRKSSIQKISTIQEKWSIKKFPVHGVLKEEISNANLEIKIQYQKDTSMQMVFKFDLMRIRSS